VETVHGGIHEVVIFPVGQQVFFVEKTRGGGAVHLLGGVVEDLGLSQQRKQQEKNGMCKFSENHGANLARKYNLPPPPQTFSQSE
jgi:hypothetical protein